MRMSTFCVLLAAVLMLMGAAAAALVKHDINTRCFEEAAFTAADGNEITDEALLETAGETVRRYGAEYNEQLGQWTNNAQLTVRTRSGENIRVCSEMRTERITRIDDGCCVELTAVDADLVIWPVTGVRVFEGSVLKRGDAVGDAGQEINILAFVNGKEADPEAFVRLSADK